MSLRSLHPNHVWQIDASRCVLFYLPRASKGDSGLRIMDHTDFYKNKPANVIKVINESLWRYVVTDHTSGWNYSTYVTGGENATNLVDVLIDAMHRREGEAMFGVPLMVMLDPGSANTSAIFKTCARRCGSTSRSTSRRTRARRARSKRARTSPSAISNPPCGCCRQTRSTAWRRSMRWWHVGAGTSTAPGSTRARANPRLCLAAYHARTIGDPASSRASAVTRAQRTRVARGFHALARQLPRFRLRRVVGAWRLRWREAAGLREPWAQDTVQVVMSDDEATRPTRSCNVSPMTTRYGRRCARDRRELCPSRRHARADQRQGPGTDGDRHLHRDRSQGGTQGRHRRLRRAD